MLSDAEPLAFSTSEAVMWTDLEGEKEEATLFGMDIKAVWILGLCTLAYLHSCSAGYVIPAITPTIASDIALSDRQVSFLTVGYTFVYAIGQVPFGFLADRVDRMKLLASGVVIWSVMTALGSKATNFTDLILIRSISAATQSMQNPISYALIPEVFPKGGTTAVSIYNSALDLGRALSYCFAILLTKIGVHGAMGIHTVPLEQFDVTTMSLLYITGNQATVVPLFDYDLPMIAQSTSNWRDLLFWIGIPGLAVAVFLALMKDPRKEQRPLVDDRPKQQSSEIWPAIKDIVKKPSFQATTLAAALNDIGFWSLVSWQTLYYERVFNIQSDIYAPILATVIPISGTLGGVGGSLLSDWLTERNARYLLTSGATLLGAPLMFMSFATSSYQSSFAYLLVGYLLLECWRASAAIMICEAAPQEYASTATAVHLSTRNMIASLGPLLIAALEPHFGLRTAICVIPVSYLASGVAFAIAERLLAAERPQMTADCSSQ